MSIVDTDRGLTPRCRSSIDYRLTSGWFTAEARQVAHARSQMLGLQENDENRGYARTTLEQMGP